MKAWMRLRKGLNNAAMTRVDASYRARESAHNVHASPAAVPRLIEPAPRSRVFVPSVTTLLYRRSPPRRHDKGRFRRPGYGHNGHDLSLLPKGPERLGAYLL